MGKQSGYVLQLVMPPTAAQSWSADGEPDMILETQ